MQAYSREPQPRARLACRIETVVRRNGDRVDIEVIDNGPGLPKHNRNRLLEPYVTTKGNKGTGLGLAIVRKASSSMAARCRSRMRRRVPAARTGRCIRITLAVEQGDGPAGLARRACRRGRRRGSMNANR